MDNDPLTEEKKPTRSFDCATSPSGNTYSAALFHLVAHLVGILAQVRLIDSLFGLAA